MADVLLCYAREDGALAGRIGAALARRGYRLWSEDDLAGEGADITDRVSAAKAAIVIWSEAGAASEWVRAEANFARGQKKLIQAADDDRPPPLPFRRADVALLAGWSGNEADPGWRRLTSELEALCGPPAAGRRARPVPPPPAMVRPARRRGGGLLAGVTLALLAAVALATFLWMQDIAPTAPAERTAPVATAPEPVAPAPPPLDMAVPAPAAAEPAPSEAAGGEAEGRPASRLAGPRINRRNSENMRLFCERAGRGTPECRAFTRRLRAQGR